MIARCGIAAAAMAACLSASSASAGIGEGVAGLSYSRIDYDEPVREEYGASLHYRHLFSDTRGWIPYAQGDFMGASLLAGDVSAGCIYRTSGSVFVDAGVGIGYSYLFRQFAVAVTGVGFEINSRLHVAMPFLLEYPGRAGFYLYPLIGWRF